MKLVVQIPCWNEEKTLSSALGDIPKHIEGMDSVVVQIVDDGSQDATVETARAAGVRHIVRLQNHQGLAKAFLAGIQNALRLGADIVVNTDADHPYKGEDIVRLVRPIVEGTADVVVGCRDFNDIGHYSALKRFLQKAGARVVNRASGVSLPDVTSGFRAYSREAALRLNVMSGFSYTLETLIQAGRMNLGIAHVTVEPNPELRPSRLYRNLFHYLFRSAFTILRATLLYYPLRMFLWAGGLSMAGALCLVARYLVYHVKMGATGHLPSLALAGVLVILSLLFGVSGLLADLVAANRLLSEELLAHARRREYSD